MKSSESIMANTYEGTRKTGNWKTTSFTSTGSANSNPSIHSEIEIPIDGDSLTMFIESVPLDRAMEQTEIGKFNIVITLICGAIFTLSSLIPSAFIQLAPVIECKYLLGLDEKKFINEVTYCGMIIGTVLISAAADYFGRKWVLVSALITNFIGVLIANTSYNANWLAVSRLITSFSISGASCITLVLLAEFALPQHRGPALCSMQLFWMLGTIVIPSTDISWFAVTIICAVILIVVIFFVMRLPETPRYLLTNLQNDEALDSIENIYEINTGMTPCTFPTKAVIDNPTYEVLSKRFLPTLIPPYMNPTCFCLPALLLLQFLLMFCYYTLATWFEELNIVSRYESFFNIAYDIDPLAETCELRNYYDLEFTENYSQNRDIPSGNHTDPKICNPTGGTLEESYRRMILVAFSCIPAIIILMMSIDIFGRKLYIALGHAGAAILCYGSYFVINTEYAVLFSCLFQAMCTFSIAATYCVAVEVMTTRHRVIGLSLVMAAGQLGAILGNWGLASAFNLPCAYLLSGISIVVYASTLLTLIFPNTIGMSLRT